MPQGDRTGPDGQGPKSGRGFGYCNGYNHPGYEHTRYQCGRGFRRGYGPGLGRGMLQPQIKDEVNDEAQSLKQTIYDLETQLDNLKRRLTTLEQSIEKNP
jgi:hypothetical protein